MTFGAQFHLLPHLKKGELYPHIPNLYVEVLTPVLPNATLFGNRAVAGLIRYRMRSWWSTMDP